VAKTKTDNKVVTKTTADQKENMLHRLEILLPVSFLFV